MARIEGWGLDGKIPTVRNNPLNLRYAQQLGASCPRCHAGDPSFTVVEIERLGHLCANNGHDIAVFQSPGIGIAAGIRQLCMWTQMRMSLTDIITRQAPPGKPDYNNTTNYLRTVQTELKLQDAQMDVAFQSLL